MGCSTRVTECGPLAAGKNRGHPAAAAIWRDMSNGVDPSEHWLQPSQRDAMPNSSFAEANPEELPACNDSMLSLREGSNRSLDLTLVTFELYLSLNLTHVQMEARRGM